MMTPKQQTSLALDWLYARVPMLDWAARLWHGDGTYVFLHPEQRHHARNCNRTMFEHSLGWMRYANTHEEADIIARPARSLLTSPLILLDDVTARRAAAIARKYSALAMETSPGNAQVVLMLTQAVSEACRKAIQLALARKISADSGSVSGEHLGRLPGFRNRKPKYASASPWVNLLDATDGDGYDPSAIEDLPEDSGEMEEPQSPPRGRDWTPRDQYLTGDPSRDDWANVRRRLVAGQTEEAVTEWLTEQASARGKHATEASCRSYAQHTVVKAARR